MNTAKELSTRLKILREVHEFTQEYVAGVLNISQNSYCLIEKGETKITIDRLMQLASLYNMDVVDLLKLNEQTYISNINNSSVNSESVNISSTINDEEREMYKKMIESQRNEIERLHNLLEKLTEKL